jgi:hypothetical protein
MTDIANTGHIILITTQKENTSMLAAHNAVHEKSTELNNNNKKNIELYNHHEKSRTEERTIEKIRPGISFSKTKIARGQNYSKGTVVCKRSKYQSSSTYLCPKSPNGQRPILSQCTKNTKISSTTQNHLKSNNLSLWTLCNQKSPLNHRQEISTPSNHHENTRKLYQ